ncbi:hypothetical protein BGW42_008271 [Actinomortierella wolfii]|nr:hypothetical protein BGW42_008271 [Actinomortierella wolfii]
MDSLVALNPGCYATDGTSIYAFDLRVRQKTSFFEIEDFYYVLVKSNPNPAPDLSDISWSVVSISNRDGLNILGDPSVCYIDPTTKAFSVLSLRSKMKKGYESQEKSVLGVHYQPKADGKGGSWTNITVTPGSPLFEWDSSIGAFYSNTQLYKPQNSESIMFATANPHIKNPNSGKSDTKLWIASMNPSELVMKQKPSPWLYDPALYGDLKEITFTNNALYFYATMSRNMTLGAVPISGDSLALSPSAVSTFDMKNIDEVCGIGAYSSLMILVPFGENIGGPVFLFDGKSITNISTSKATSGSAILTMPGTVPFLFAASTDNLYSLPISGPNAGKWFDTKMITIPASALESLTPSGPVAGSGNTSKSGIIIGVVCAVLVLIIGGVGYFWYRKRSAQNKSQHRTHYPLESVENLTKA